ncbi:MAG: zinc ribbon domain-containing protein [Leptospirales bacterium]|jgi:putative FmdB family regulatory protein
MPTYTYECKDCGNRYDAFQSMSAAADTECPQCKGRVERVIGGGSGIVFKGSGFYVTDYKKDSGSGAATKSAGTGAESPGSASSTTGSSASASGSSPSSSSGAAKKSD